MYHRIALAQMEKTLTIIILSFQEGYWCVCLGVFLKIPGYEKVISILISLLN